jgi:hypothetical protein
MDHGNAGDFLGMREVEEQSHLTTTALGKFGDVQTFLEDSDISDLVAGVPHQDVGKRRFARPVRPHQRMDLTLIDDEVDAFEDFGIFSRSVKVLDTKQGSRVSHNPIVFALPP